MAGGRITLERETGPGRVCPGVRCQMGHYIMRGGNTKWEKSSPVAKISAYVCPISLLNRSTSGVANENQSSVDAPLHLRSLPSGRKRWLG